VATLLATELVLRVHARLTTDGRGFRRTGSGSDAAEAVRLVGLGDSNMFGWGVADDETYLARLESTRTWWVGPPSSARSASWAGCASFTAFTVIVLSQAPSFDWLQHLARRRSRELGFLYLDVGRVVRRQVAELGHADYVDSPLALSEKGPAPLRARARPHERRAVPRRGRTGAGRSLTDAGVRNAARVVVFRAVG
jgi:hypothetical protein